MENKGGTLDSPTNDAVSRMRRFYETSTTYRDLLGPDSTAARAQALGLYVALMTSSTKVGDWILDLGCGRGITSARLASTGRCVVGVELSENLLAARDRVAPQALWVVARADQLPFRSKSFKAVGMNDVIEHVTDVPDVLTDVRRVTSTPGHVLIVSPNLLSPLRPVKALLRLDRVTLGFYGNRLAAAAAIIGNVLRLAGKRLSRQPRFLYREPTLAGFEGPDDDANYLCTSIDLLRWFRLHGMSARRLRLPLPPRSTIARLKQELAFRLPDLDKGFALVAVKRAEARRALSSESR